MILTLTVLYGNVYYYPKQLLWLLEQTLAHQAQYFWEVFVVPWHKKKLALAQVLFNIVVDVFAFISIDYLLYFISLMSIQDPLVGLVAFHSLFNLLGLIAFIPFISQYSLFLEKIIKVDKDKDQLTEYINNVPRNITDAAIKALDLETKRLMSLVLILNLKFLKIDSHLLQDISIPFAFKNKPNLAFYLSIKELEGEIVNYALSVQTTKNQLLIGEGGNDFIAHQIDHYMKANRASIYAAKSLKDIHENIDVFNDLDNPKLIEIYAEIIDSTEKNYVGLLELMGQEDGLIEEYIQNLREKTAQSHQYFRSQLHQHMSSNSIGSFNLSTLLNVNQEIFTSVNALIDALYELLQAEQSHTNSTK